MSSVRPDIFFMREAYLLAEQGQYSSPPHPSVGCVVVKNNTIVGRGFHRKAGQPHAEIVALSDAGELAEGATAYVTLEPCNHYGRTGPCSEALIDAGISKVVYSRSDPNLDVAGGGHERLVRAGVSVIGNVGEPERSGLNDGFFFRAKTGRPRIRIKVAMSIDGRSALESGESKWITGPESRAEVQKLRAESCAILTGIGTVAIDNPSLNVRDSSCEMYGRQPDRIILDSRLKIGTNRSIFKGPGKTRIFTRTQKREKERLLQEKGAEITEIAEENGKLDLRSVVDVLKISRYNDVLVEAGPTLTAAFLNKSLFDELIIFMAPMLMGKDARPALGIHSPDSLKNALGLKLISHERVASDIALRFVKPQTSN